MPQIASVGETLCMIIPVERKGLKEAKKAIPVRMPTTIGGRQAGKTQEEAEGGTLGGIACESHQGSRALALSLQENGAQSSEQRGPLSGSLF